MLTFGWDNRGEIHRILGELLGESAQLTRLCNVFVWRCAMLISLVLSVGRPEDIFGSVQVDGEGNIEGNFQASGTYRIVTNDGM